MFQATTLTATQTMLMHARCPLCNGLSLDLRMHCEMGSGCNYGVHCTRCQLHFDIRTEKLPSNMPRLLENLVCPACTGHGGRVSIACAVETRSCEQVVVCRHCEHSFTGPIH